MFDASRQTLATNGGRNRQRPCPPGAFYGQEAPCIGVKARIASTDMQGAVESRGGTLWKHHPRERRIKFGEIHAV
jgi:hypothetical protein